jgi:hypothetical protein
MVTDDTQGHRGALDPDRLDGGIKASVTYELWHGPAIMFVEQLGAGRDTAAAAFGHIADFQVPQAFAPEPVDFSHAALFDLTQELPLDFSRTALLDTSPTDLPEPGHTAFLDLIQPDSFDLSHTAVLDLPVTAAPSLDVQGLGHDLAAPMFAFADFAPALLAFEGHGAFDRGADMLSAHASGAFNLV